MKKIAPCLSRLIVMIAVLTVGLCSSVMNFRFGYHLANSQFDGLVIGTLSVSLDIVKMAAPVFATLAFSRQAYLRAISSTLIWVVCVSFSLTAAIGFSASNRDTVISARSNDAESYRRASQDRESILRDLDAMKGNRRWAATSGCTNATASKSVAFCKSVRDTENRLRSVNLVLASSRQITTDDPQASTLSRISGLSRSHVQIALVILVAVVSELVSSLGLFAVTVPPKSRQVQTKPKKRTKTTKRRPPKPISGLERAKQSSILIPATTLRSLLL